MHLLNMQKHKYEIIMNTVTLKNKEEIPACF